MLGSDIASPPSKSVNVSRSAMTPASAETMPPANSVQAVIKLTVSWKPSLRVIVKPVSNATRMA